jgi:hypothetical protein
MKQELSDRYRLFPDGPFMSAVLETKKEQGAGEACSNYLDGVKRRNALEGLLAAALHSFFGNISRGR